MSSSMCAFWQQVPLLHMWQLLVAVLSLSAVGWTKTTHTLLRRHQLFCKGLKDLVSSCLSTMLLGILSANHMCCALQVIVITGDNKLTAEAICRKVGVFAVDDDLQGKSVTGVEFSKMSLEDRRAFLNTTEGACFSRAEPKHKQVSWLWTAPTNIYLAFYCQL